MRICNIQTTENLSHTNFTSLKILEDGIFSRWPKKTLEDFVRNKEVQIFVKIMHNKEKDVSVAFFSNRLNNFAKEISISLVDRKNYLSDIPFAYNLPAEAIESFSAKTAVQAYEKTVNESILHKKDLTNAMTFVEKFNKTLEQEEKTAKIIKM